jgi:hypothetical protein
MFFAYTLYLMGAWYREVQMAQRESGLKLRTKGGSVRLLPATYRLSFESKPSPMAEY